MTPTDDPQGSVPEATDAEQLASALLDGAATDAEATRAAEPAVVAAGEAFERVARAIADPVEVDEERRATAIAAALDAWPGAAGEAAVDELAQRRRGRRGLVVAGVAAAVIAAVGLAGVATLDTRDSSEETAAVATDDEAFEDHAADQDAPDAAEGAESGAAADALPASELAILADLGIYDDLDALIADAAARSAPVVDSQTTVAGGSESAAGEESGTDEPCAEPAPPAGSLRSTATATLDGRPVTVVVVDGDEGRVVQVVDQVSCSVLFVGAP